MKSWVKIIGVIVIVLLVFFLLLISPFIVAYTFGQIERFKISNKIFDYVLENSDFIDLINPEKKQYFLYHEWGFIDAGITYGYYFSPEDEYQKSIKSYRTGCLKYGTPYSGVDWCYIEEICDNWYYSEEHYG